MKSLLLLAGMLLVLDVQAQSSFTDGNKLLEACRVVEAQPGSFMAGVCGGYVSALADVMSNPVAIHACIPAGVTRSQVVAVVTKALRDHPEQLHYTASSTAMVALSAAFPCK